MTTTVAHGGGRSRVYGPGHLLVAGLPGGVAACCWLLHRNERLRTIPRVPWRTVACAAFAAEAVLVVLWVRDVGLPGWGIAAACAVGFAVVVAAAQVRYREERRLHVPAIAQDAVAVGWVFAGMRVLVAVTAMYLAHRE